MKIIAYTLIFINAIPFMLFMWRIVVRMKDLGNKISLVYAAIRNRTPITEYNGIEEALVAAYTGGALYWLIRMYGTYLLFYCNNIVFFTTGIPIDIGFYTSNILIYFLLIFVTIITLKVNKGDQMKWWAIEKYIFRRKRK